MRKKKPTKGEKIAAKFFDWLPEEAIDNKLAKAIDRAIRAAVKEAWYAGVWAGKCCPFEKNHPVRIPLENKYGVKL